MIKITKELLSSWFADINSLYFNGELRTPNYVISTNRSRFGQFRPKTWTIEMSTAWVRSERDYYNTFLHELCHLYVRQTYGYYVQAHGYEWKEIAKIITDKTNKKYGIIQRVGGGQDKYTLRNTKEEKFVVFTDLYGELSISKFRNIEYVNNMKEYNCIKSGTTIYILVSDDAEMLRYKLRKVNTSRIHWSHTSMTLDEFKERSRIVDIEFFTKLNGVA